MFQKLKCHLCTLNFNLCNILSDLLDAHFELTSTKNTIFFVLIASLVVVNASSEVLMRLQIFGYFEDRKLLE